MVTKLANVLEALRPRVDQNKEGRSLLDHFFGSITVPELLPF